MGCEEDTHDVVGMGGPTTSLRLLPALAGLLPENGFVAGGPALPEDEAAMNGIRFRQ